MAFTSYEQWQENIGLIGSALNSSTATLSQVNASITSVSLLAANSVRKGATIVNNGTANLYIAFAASASTTAFTAKLSAGASYTLPNPVYQGAISGIWDAANGTAQITELT
jgi:hypothetical protein